MEPDTRDRRGERRHEEPERGILETDFHVHGGAERNGKPVETFLQVLAERGVTVAGVLDHIELYIPESPWAHDHRAACLKHSVTCYPLDKAGLAELYRDIDAATRPAGMRLLKGLEFGNCQSAPEEMLAMPDYVCFCFGDVSKLPGETFGMRAAARIREVGKKVKTTGKPGIVNHPFRNWIWAYRERMEKNEAPAIEQHLTRDDVARMAEAAHETGLALEINQHDIMTSSEQPDGPVMALCRHAVRLLAESGANLSIGSDMHHPSGSFCEMVPQLVHELGLRHSHIAALFARLEPMAR